MIVLKFMSWMVLPKKRENPNDQPAARDRVISCDSYEIEHYPERQAMHVHVFRGDSPVPFDTVLMGAPETQTDLTKFRKLYVMNEQGKTIDSYSPEERRG